MDDNYLDATKPGPCALCGEPATTVEVNFEAHLHPGPCADALWAQYWAALARPPGPGADSQSVSNN